MAIGTLLTVLSAGVGAAGSILGGMSAKQQADAQAAQLERQANAERAQASQASAQKYNEQKALMSDQIAIAAASGGDASDPSILDLQADTAGRGFQQRQTINANGENIARGYEEQADAAKLSGKSALMGGFIGAGTSILGSASKAYQTYGAKYMPTAAANRYNYG